MRLAKKTNSGSGRKMETSEKAGGLRSDLPVFGPGDTVVIDYKVVEGGKERTQPFQGIVMGRSGSGADETFTVRRVLQGVGVERIIPVQSPMIKKLRVIRKGSVRRAKLNYLREARGKQARIKEARKDKATGKQDAGAEKAE